MKVLFHVGPHKTGTTSLQHFLKINSQNLLAQSIVVPSIEGIDKTSNHWYLIYVASKNDERSAAYHNSIRGGHGPEQCKIFRERYDHSLRTALEDCKKTEEIRNEQQTFVVSTEEIAFLEREENNFLYRLFLEYSDTLEIFYYYRSPIDRLRSDLQQGSKGGHIHHPRILKNLPCQDTARIRKLYPTDDIKNKVTIKVRPYFRGIDGFSDWDIRLDFCNTLGIDLNPLNIPAKDPGANSNISLQMFSVLQSVNSAMPTLMPDGKFNQYKRHFHDAIENYNWTPEDTPFKFSPDDLRDLLESRSRMEGFLSLSNEHSSLQIEPGCRRVFDSMADVKTEAGVEGSIFNYIPSMTHKYYVNLLCHFWSFQHKMNKIDQKKLHV